MTGRLTQAAAWLRAHGPATALEGLVNFGLPWAIYHWAHGPCGDVRALLFASGPPIAWSLVEFARRRRIDAVSMLVIAGIALSLLAFIGGGGARFLQLRETLVTGLIGLIFLASAAIRRPLIYELARATMRRRAAAAELGEFESLRDNIYFRRTMTLMTLVWGFGLILQTALACVLVFAMSIGDYLIASPILGYGTLGGLCLWTAWYGRRQRAKGAARRAAEARLSYGAEAE